MIDSLKIELSMHEKKDTTRVNILYNLANSYFKRNNDKAKEYIEKAEALAVELNFVKGQIDAIYLRGVLQDMLSNSDAAFKHFENAIQLYADNGIQKKIPRCYVQMAIMHYVRQNYKEAIVNYRKAFEIEEELGIKRDIPYYRLNMGITYTEMGSYKEAIAEFSKALKVLSTHEDKSKMLLYLKYLALIINDQGNYAIALDYNKKAIELAEKMQDSSEVSDCLNKISYIYKTLGDYDKALESLEKSITIQENMGNVDRIAAVKNDMAAIYIEKGENFTAIKHATESLEMSRKTDNTLQIGACLNNLGYAYISLKQYKKALKYHEEAKDINLKIDNQEALCYSYLGMAKSLVKERKHPIALPYLSKSLKIAKKFRLVKNQRDAYKLLSEVYKAKGLYKKAFQSFQYFSMLKDSLFNEESIQKIATLKHEYKYKQERDSLKIEELQLKKIVQTTHQELERTQQNLLYGVITFLVLVLVMGSLLFASRLRHEKAKTQNAIIEQKLLRSQMTPHFIFNSLSVLQGLIFKKEEKHSITYLSKFSRLLRTILENSRHKTVALSKELTAIHEYVTLQNLDKNPPYKYRLTVAPEIETTTLKIPPMLIQPFIENAIEHAFPYPKESKEINVTLSYNDEQLVCAIDDNGIGVDMEQQRKNKHKKSLATTITSERLKVLSRDLKKEGSIMIKNKKSLGKQGTLVTLVIPYKTDVSA